MATEPAADGGASPHPVEGRGFRVALGLALIGVLVLLWPVLCTAPALHWNPARLAPSFALAFGKSIYALRNSAEQLGWIYGPVLPLWYLPVTLTSNPTVALVLATVGNAFTLLAPLVLVLRRAGVTRPATLTFALVLFAALLMAHGILRWEFYFIHVDTVCVALGLVACVALHRAVERQTAEDGGQRSEDGQEQKPARPAQGEGWPLHVAALAAALAIWTKQLAVMLVPGMLLWLWADGPRRLLFPFFFRWVCYFGGLSVAILLWFGPERVIFSVVLYHLRSPVQGGVGLIGRWLVDVATGFWTWLPVLGVAWWRGVGFRPTEEGAGRSASSGRESREQGAAMSASARSLMRLLLWVALAQLPLGLLALQRPDGGVNSLHSLQYVLVAGIVWVVVKTEDGGRRTEDGRRRTEDGGRRAETGARDYRGLAWGVALLLTVGFGFLHTLRARPEWRIYRGQEELLAKVQASPNTYYLPWNPLITLMGERKIYPFDDALQCLWLRRLEVPPAVVRAALPPKPILLYYEPVQSKFALRYFPEMRR